MKRRIALVLVMALLTSFCSGAFADTLQLSAGLTVVEEDSFSDNPALDEVKLSWGMEAIESRAFANSGVRRIYIPATVMRIADDAFAGTNVTICATADSYAKEYADAHGIAWEATGSSKRVETISQLEDLATQPRGEEYQPLALLEKLPTDGIEDPQELAEADAYNAAVDDLNAELEALNREEAERGETMNALVAQLPSVSITEEGSQVHVDMDGLALVIDKDVMNALGQGMEVASAGGDDDGVTCLTLADDTRCYLYLSEDTYYYTRTAPNATARSNSALAVANAPHDTAWARFVGLVDQIENLVSVFDDLLKDNTEFFGSELQRIEAKYEALALQQSSLTGKAKELAENLQQQRERELRILRKKHSLWSNAGKLWTAVDIAATFSILRQIVVDWRWLNDISQHNHPNENDTSALAQSIANTMNTNIVALRALYALDGSMCVANLILSVSAFAASVPTGGASITVKVVIAAVKMLIGIFLNAGEDMMYDAIDKAEKQLHTYVYGWVTDKDTGKPIRDVDVTDGYNRTHTDENGYYEIYIVPNDAMPSTVTLVFRTDDYSTETNDNLSEERKVELVYGDHVECNVEMMDEIPIDEEHFPDEHFRQAVSERDENKNEKLSRDERTGGGLSISGAANLNGLNYFRELGELKLIDCMFDEFNLSDHANLDQLWTLNFEGGSIVSIDVSNWESLLGLTCVGTRQLERINASGCVNLNDLEARGGNHEDRYSLSELDVTGCASLQYLFCDYNQLHSLDLHDLTELLHVNLHYNQLTSLDVSGCTKLEYFFCSHNQLSSLNVSNCPAMKQIDFRYNEPLSGTMSLLGSPEVFVASDVTTDNEGQSNWYTRDYPRNLGTSLTAVYVSHSSYFWMSRPGYSDPEHRYRGIIK